VKVLLFANTAWYLYNFRCSLAVALQEAGHDVLLVSPPGPYGERLRTLGLRWVPAPMKRTSLNPLRELVLVLWLRSLMVRERVNVMHGFTIKCAVYGSLAARLAGVSARLNAVAGMGYVFTSPDLKARTLRPVVRNLLRLALQGRSARLVLQNPDDVALFKSARLVDSASIRLIPGSGVDCRRFTPDFTRIPGGRFRVLLAARLLWDKGLDEYVSAARELKAQGRDIEFLLAGSPDPGNPTAVPEETVQAWGKERLVILLGHIDDMPALFRSVDAVILPSYREGLPKGLVEAGACGLALVATDVPGCREVVTDGVDGLLVPVRDFKALAAAIARLQDTPALAARLGVAAREKAVREFDERLVIERTLRVYDELLQAV
jgi:glycosyltransferase involved in cell wall biosynthesis